MSLSIIPIGGYSKIEGNSVAIKVDNEVVILDMGLSMENYVQYQDAETKKTMVSKEDFFMMSYLRQTLSLIIIL